jgi:ubiquinone/menaquinone biosynthesis C-methylase UbiE
VRSRTEAFRYVDRLIAADLRGMQQQFRPPLRVLDFGCGFGSSLMTLAVEPQIEGVGITLSSVQARRAQERFAAADVAHRLQCIQGNFLDLSEVIAPAHLVFSIEAFVHSPSPQTFFQAVARHIQPGGMVIVCDDFLSEGSNRLLSSREACCLEEFRHGWAAPSVVTLANASRAAAEAGFEPIASLDLTKYLELGRPRDRLLSFVVSLMRYFPIPGYRWRSLLGGNALQTALGSGLLEYRYTVWRQCAPSLKKPVNAGLE